MTTERYFIVHRAGINPNGRSKGLFERRLITKINIKL